MGSLVTRLLRFVSVKTSLLVGYLGVTVLCGVLVAALAIPGIALVAYGSKRAATVVEDAPEQLPQPTFEGFSHVYDGGGKLLATFYSRNQVPVELSQVAPVMRTAMVDIEDERFYSHGAADPKGIVRAFAENQASGQTVAGGSTLTQQYVKNVLLQEADTPAEQRAATVQDTARKVQELRYAIGVEKRMTKDQILQGYLNVATFGRSVYGVQAAAQYYFGVDASKLTLPQSAMIAGMTQSPSRLDPTGPKRGAVDPARDARTRRNIVLDKMYSLGHITKAQWTAARASGLGIVNGGRGRAPERGCVSASAAWYCNYVENLLLRDPEFSALGSTADQRSASLYGGGLEVTTALDPRVQDIVDSGLHKASNPTDSVVAATAVVKPGSGAVVAISNSKSFDQSPDAPKGSTAVNYAVQYPYGGSNGFQPGSSMKSFVTAAALDDGSDLGETIDSPYALPLGGERFAICQGDQTSYKTPSEYVVHNAGRSENGTYSMNEALQLSVNTYFLQLEQQVGICKPAQLAAAAGLHYWDTKGEQQPLQQVATFTLGVDTVSPLQMSAAYAMFAAGGIYCQPQAVVKIVKDGKTVYDPGPQCRRLVPEGVAQAVAWSLYHNVEGDQFSGTTAAGLKIGGIPFAGKTGTNNLGNGQGPSAVWFNGFNPQFASSTAVGNAKNQRGLNGQRIGGRTISSASGAKVAGAVWEAYMEPLLQAQSTHPGFDTPPQEYLGSAGGFSFAAPDPFGQAQQDQQGTVPDVADLPADTAAAVLTAAGFDARQGTSGKYADGGTPAGSVIRTYPRAGADASPGTQVFYYVATGGGG